MVEIENPTTSESNKQLTIYAWSLPSALRILVMGFNNLGNLIKILSDSKRETPSMILLCWALNTPNVSPEYQYCPKSFRRYPSVMKLIRSIPKSKGIARGRSIALQAHHLSGSDITTGRSPCRQYCCRSCSRACQWGRPSWRRAAPDTSWRGSWTGCRAEVSWMGGHAQCWKGEWKERGMAESLTH